MIERLESLSATNGRAAIVLASLVMLAYANVVNGPLFRLGLDWEVAHRV